MADIVSISEYRERSAVRAGYKLWNRFFKDAFDAGTRLQDLRPVVLCRLAEPGRSSDLLLYGLIIGFLGYTADERFETLDKRTQLHVLDIHLFLTDQIRFEMMLRLGWVARFGAEEHALFDLVRQFNRLKQHCQSHPPELAANHPGFEQYVGLVDQDKQVFIRRLFQSALETFKRLNPS